MLAFDRLIRLHLFTWMPDDVVRLICEHWMQAAARVIQHAWLFHELPDLIEADREPDLNLVQAWQAMLTMNTLQDPTSIHSIIHLGNIYDGVIMEEID